MKLQEVRKARGIEQAALAKNVGVSVPMMSNFENYKCLPIPVTMKAICSELKCERKDIYEDKELYFPETKAGHKTKFGCRLEPDVYKLSVRLPERARKVLTQENLEKCGYHSLKDFVWHCFMRFEKQLAILNKKEKATKQTDCHVAYDESGLSPTHRTNIIDHFSKKINS